MQPVSREPRQHEQLASILLYYSLHSQVAAPQGLSRLHRNLSCPPPWTTSNGPIFTPMVHGGPMKKISLHRDIQSHFYGMRAKGSVNRGE
jgi:hypothetical protein